MDLFSYASGKLSGIIGDSPSPMHYREKYHRGAPDTPDELGGYRGCAPDTFPFPGASVGDSLKNETAPDPAKNFPTRASRAAAFAAWQAAGEPWPPPAGLVSAGMDRLQRSNRGANQWRK